MLCSALHLGWQRLDMAEDGGAAHLLAAGIAQAGAAALAREQQCHAVAPVCGRGRMVALRHRCEEGRQLRGFKRSRTAGLAAAQLADREGRCAHEPRPQAVHHLQPRLRLLQLHEQRERGALPSYAIHFFCLWKFTSCIFFVILPDLHVPLLTVQFVRSASCGREHRVCECRVKAAWHRSHHVMTFAALSVLCP